jgi:hypothetical protein
MFARKLSDEVPTILPTRILKACEDEFVCPFVKSFLLNAMINTYKRVEFFVLGLVMQVQDFSNP